MIALIRPEVDMRNFRLNKLNTPEYRHFWWLLFWPVYILRYMILENLTPAAEYTVMHCALDDRIPFCEWFLIFYVSWYVVIVGMHLYLALYDVAAFKRYSKFLAISMTISTLTILLFPTCQELRPEVFPRDNLLSRIMGYIYTVDDNCGVFPSEHVIGAVAVFAAAVHCKNLRSPGKLTVIGIWISLIILSTVFVKQHSVLDVLGAIVPCAVAYYFAFVRKRQGAELERKSSRLFDVLKKRSAM